jgi:hypothetical protein
LIRPDAALAALSCLVLARRRKTHRGVFGAGASTAAVALLLLAYGQFSSLLPLAQVDRSVAWWDEHGSDFPPGLITPVTRNCPVAFPDSPSTPEEFAYYMNRHLPHRLPEGFGLVAWSAHDRINNPDLVAFGRWADERCRQLVLRHLELEWGDPLRDQFLAGDRVGGWTLTRDVRERCGKPVVGTGRCLEYQAHTPRGRLVVRLYGVDRETGDRIAMGITIHANASSTAAAAPVG